VIRRAAWTALAAALAVSAAFSESVVERPEETVSFPETWAYLGVGDEAKLNGSFPVTDIAYFSASISNVGSLSGVPDFEKIAAAGVRKHLVVAELGNAALTHFCLDPQYPLRDALVSAISEAAAPYDGVQVDFEAVMSRDGALYVDFLERLKAALGNKTLSVAVPARRRATGDAYDYGRIGAVADRVVVMAYDEHWSGGAPGPVASAPWTAKVADYALQNIGSEKLVMGLPFYGRAWPDKQLSRAYNHSGIMRILNEQSGSLARQEGDVPNFEYQETVTVRVFFEDVRSLLSKLRAYREASVRAVAFWRFGQEDPSVWSILRVGE
jgi:spore germination protein YaaH